MAAHQARSCALVYLLCLLPAAGKQGSHTGLPRHVIPEHLHTHPHTHTHSRDGSWRRYTTHPPIPPETRTHINTLSGWLTGACRSLHPHPHPHTHLTLHQGPAPPTYRGTSFQYTSVSSPYRTTNWSRPRRSASHSCSDARQAGACLCLKRAAGATPTERF